MEKNNLKKEREENQIVEIILHDDSDTIKKYKCVGVLMKENEKTLRIGFNAVENVVKDYLDIKKKNIVDIKTINPKEISSLF